MAWYISWLDKDEYIFTFTPTSIKFGLIVTKWNWLLFHFIKFLLLFWTAYLFAYTCTMITIIRSWFINDMGVYKGLFANFLSFYSSINLSFTYQFGMWFLNPVYVQYWHKDGDDHNLEYFHLVIFIYLCKWMSDLYVCTCKNCQITKTS